MSGNHTSDILQTSLQIKIGILNKITNEAPTEILSEIFETYNSSDPWISEDQPCIPLQLAAVCRRWRDVALHTPHLWSWIVIHAKGSWENRGFLKVIKEFLSYSKTLPLSIRVTYDRIKDAKFQLFDELTELLRSSSARWRDVRILDMYNKSYLHDLVSSNDGTWNPPLCLDLFEFKLSHANLDPGFLSAETPNMLQPRKIIMQGTLNCLPLGFQNLVSITSERGYLRIEEILHVIKHATKLTECRLGRLDSISAKFMKEDSPQTPIVHRLITHFSVGKTTVLRFLTLPGIQSLDLTFTVYDDDNYNDPNAENIDDILQFVTRSAPPLTEFSLNLVLEKFSNELCSKLEKLPSVTFLRLTPIDIEAEVGDRMGRKLLSNLAYPSREVLLPNLKELHLDVPPKPGRKFWSCLAGLFPAQGHGCTNLGVNDSMYTDRSDCKIYIYLGSQWLSLHDIPTGDMYRKFTVPKLFMEESVRHHLLDVVSRPRPESGTDLYIYHMKHLFFFVECEYVAAA